MVIGASENPTRYSYKAILSLTSHGHEVVAISDKKGQVAGIDFQTSLDLVSEIDTITLYVNPKIQEMYYDYILLIKPRRVIFNPGAENSSFMALLKQNNIESVIACTLVMLSTKQF